MPLSALSDINNLFVFLLEAMFSLICGTSALLFYGWLYVYTLKILPQCFTFGEASIVVQGFILFLVNAALRFFAFSTYNEDHNIDDISLILQVRLSNLQMC